MKVFSRVLLEMYVTSCNLELACRICLVENATIDLYTSSENKPDSSFPPFWEMIQKLFCLKIQQVDGWPGKICLECNKIIISSFQLKLTAEKTENILNKHFSTVLYSNTLKSEIVTHDDIALHCHSPNSCDIANESKSSSPNEDCIANYKNAITDQEKESRLNICELCGKHVKFIKQHKKSHNPSKTKVPCGECNKTFSDHSACKRHVTIVHQGEFYFCEICKKHYKRGAQHMAIAHSKRTRDFKCDFCHKKFYDKNQLNKHITIHTAEKPFSCQLCERKFRIKSSLDSHRRNVHEKERTNMCHYCSKGFFSAQNLQEHIRIHTNDRKYKCLKCDNSYKSHSALRRHTLSHIGIKSEKCTICSKAFYHKRALKVHMYCHSAEKKFTCRFCETKFSRSDTRQRHERNSHRVGLKPD